MSSLFSKEFANENVTAKAKMIEVNQFIDRAEIRFVPIHTPNPIGVTNGSNQGYTYMSRFISTSLSIERTFFSLSLSICSLFS